MVAVARKVTKIWTTREGERIRICDMTDKHLRNFTEWEFKLAADAPSVLIKWGGFTRRQRKYLREIVKKIVGAP